MFDSSASPNRKSPQFVEYFQTLADLTRVFWEFYKLRMKRDGQLFLAEADFNQRNEVKLVPFDPNQEIQYRKDNPGSRKFDVMHSFSEAARYALATSWEQFLGDNQTKPAGYEQFTEAPYVLELIRKANEFSTRFSTIGEGNLEVSDVVSRGMATATMVSAQLSAVFGDRFKPIMALILSKVRQDDLKKTREGIGIVTSAFDESPRTYELVQPDEKFGLDMDALKSKGLGDALGCPAGMKPSTECVDFLKRVLPMFGIVDPKVEGVMLTEFAEEVFKAYEKEVKAWYEGLSEEDKGFIDDRNRELIEGKVLEKIIEERENQEGEHFLEGKRSK